MRGLVEKLALPLSRSPSPPESPNTPSSPVSALLPVRRNKVRLLLIVLVGSLLLVLQFGLRGFGRSFRSRHPILLTIPDDIPTAHTSSLYLSPSHSYSHTQCPGPDNFLIPPMEAYTHTWSKHPSPKVGSYELTSLPTYCTSYSQRYAAAASYSHLPNGSWARAVDTCLATTSYSGPKQAVVLRSYEHFNWHPDDILHLRAMITELVLNTGGQYQLFILVEVKSDEAVYASQAARDRVLDRAVPSEFREFAVLWSENMMTTYYPGLGPPQSGHTMTGHYRGCQLPLVNFALNHPEFEYIWNWEMDVRYTGNYLDLFSAAEEFARGEKRQPDMKAYARWHVPGVAEWTTRAEEEGGRGYSARLERKHDDDERYPTDAVEREEADYISFMPIFDPRGSKWTWEQDVHGFANGTAQDRRASINTCNRVSRKLLLSMNEMHAENRQILFCEAMGPTAALLYNHKAVYFPHPVYVDNDWSSKKVDEKLNDKLFYSKRGEKNARRTTYYYDSRHAFELYAAWREAEREGRKTCRMPMLVHPIKTHWFGDRDEI